MVEVIHVYDDSSSSFQRQMNNRIKEMDEQGKRLIDIKHSCSMAESYNTIRNVYSAVLMFDAGPADILAQPTE